MEDLVPKIDKLIALLADSLEDPEGLSNIIFRLSKLNYELGDLVTEAQLMAQEAEDDYKHAVDARKLELMEKDGKSATAAETWAKVELANIKDAQTKADANYWLLKRKRESLFGMIDAGRSRLSLIKQDIRS